MEPAAAKLTEGSVGRHLYEMALPVTLAVMTMMGQALIDAWFLGRVGDDALAAFGFSFPVLMVVTSIAIGMGAGTSSVVARAYGARDEHRARRLTTDSLMLSFAITAVVTVAGILTIEPLFRLLGAPDELLPSIRSFMIILYLSVPLIVVGMVGMASMRATGDTRLPSKMMIYGAVLNVILDPIFIFGLGPIPAMGLDGAALAAFFARAILFFGTLYMLRYRLNMVSTEPSPLSEIRKSCRDILHVGVPAAATNAIVPLGLAIITAMIARYGAEAVAGFGVASRIESMMLVPFYGLSAIIGPFVGQNLAAAKEERILHALKLCVTFCLVGGLVMAAILASLAQVLPTFFSDNETVNEVARLFLWIAPVGYGAYGMVMVMNASFNGLGKPLPGVMVSVGRILLLYVPLAFLARHYFEAAGIFGAYAVANVITGAAAYYWAKRVVRKQFAKLHAAKESLAVD